MNNEIVLVEENGSLVNRGVMTPEKLNERFSCRLSVMSQTKPTPENSEFCSKIIVDNNKLLKELDGLRSDIENEAIGKISEALQPIIGPIEGFRQKAKAYQAENLEAKKERFKQKAHEVYNEVLGGVIGEGVSGIPPKFDDVYADDMYGLNGDYLKRAFRSKLTEALEEDDPKAVAIFTIKGSKMIKKAEKALIVGGVSYEKEVL